MTRISLAVLAFVATTSTAMAGGPPVVVPGPEAGAGLAALTLMGATVAWLRKRRQR